MTRRSGRLCLTAAGAVWLAGCGSYPLPRVYVLGTPGPAVPGVASEAGSPSVALATVSVPDALDTTDITRLGDHDEIIASPTGRWGARVSVGITEALLGDLSRRLPRVVFATRGLESPSRRLVVSVERFEIDPDGRCVLAARWRADPPAGEVPAASHEGVFVAMAAGKTDAAAAAAMTAAIDQLSAAVAETVAGALSS